MSETRDQVHPFFLFEEPENVLQSLLDCRELLDRSKQTFIVHKMKENTIKISSTSMQPADTAIAIRRAIRLMKTHENDEVITDNCSAIIAHLCGDCARPDLIAIVRFEISENSFQDFELVLPEFASGDVGCRIWGASYLLARLIIDVKINLQNRNVIEIGASSGLAGIVAASIDASHVHLTDFNEACLKAARASSEKYSNVQVNYLDWTIHPLDESINWKNAIVIGAAVVYEEQHADLVANFLKQAFLVGISTAYIAIHKQHYGFDSFAKRLNTDFASVISFCCMRVEEEHFLSEVVVFQINSE